MRVVNHLPIALHHYTGALLSCLPAPVLVTSPSTEARGARAQQLRLGLRAVQELRRVEGDLLRLWPAFGRFEPALARAWRDPRARWWQVVHDPVPLDAPEETTGRWQQVWRRLADLDPLCTLVVHSEEARDLIGAAGVPEERCLLLPHPVHAPRPASASERQGVLVLGAWKPSRDTELMSELARRLPGTPMLLAGRGWPPVAGWHAMPGLLPEREVDALLDQAAVLLVPYRRFYQSGVMIRALERGVPCVAPRTGFTATVAGPLADQLLVTGDDPDAWAAAIERAPQTTQAWAERAREVHLRTREAYTSWHDSW